MLLGLLLLAAGGRIDPGLAAHLDTLAPHEPVRVLVSMDERYDAGRLLRESNRLPRSARAAFVRERLSRFASRSQRELSRRVALLRDEDAARSELLWIVNARAITCRAEDVADLAATPGVDTVRWDPPLAPEALEDAAPVPPAPLAGSGAASSAVATPNVIGHQANRLWRLGIDGSDVLILTIDSGVARDHPDLASRIWSNPGEIPANGVDDDGNGYVDDVWGWDFVDDDADPRGTEHGTYTAGILVGDGTANGGTATGMAPGATLAVARVSSQGQMFAAYQYAITIGADCVSSSHSIKWPFAPDYAAFRFAMTAELAAGIVHANSIGNQGLELATHPTPWNIAAPANCPGPWVHPQQELGGRASVLAVGAILLDGDARWIASGRGPSAWEDVRISSPGYPHAQDPDYWDYPYNFVPQQGLLKPDLVAYTGVTTTAGSSGYVEGFGGTSAATPHVGGALALLLDANASALPRQLAQALQETALDLEAPGKDTFTGAGKLQVYDAALRVMSLVTAVPNDPRLGEVFELRLSGPAGRPFVLGISDRLGTWPTPFGFDVELASPLVLATGTLTGQDTPVTYPIRVPAHPSLSGLEAWFQLLTDDTRGLTGGWLRSLVEPLRVR